MQSEQSIAKLNLIPILSSFCTLHQVRQDLEVRSYEGRVLCVLCDLRVKVLGVGYKFRGSISSQSSPALFSCSFEGKSLHRSVPLGCGPPSKVSARIQQGRPKEERRETEGSALRHCVSTRCSTSIFQWARWQRIYTKEAKLTKDQPS